MVQREFARDLEHALAQAGRRLLGTRFGAGAAGGGCGRARGGAAALALA